MGFREKTKVLIVDDSPALVALMKSLLIHEGYHVVGDVASGKALKAAIEREQPDMILLDYNLPDSNGLALLKAIKSSNPAIMVIMVTGDNDPQVEQKAADSGASGFIKKPFTPDSILKQLSLLINAQNLIEQHTKQKNNISIKATAIVADDSNTMRSLLVAILSDLGINVLAQATNGKEALELVLKHQPDLACLDIEMPIMDGLAALDKINCAQLATKVVMVTGDSSKNAVVFALQNGAKGFIVKPYEPTKVSAQLVKLLGVVS